MFKDRQNIQTPLLSSKSKIKSTQRAKRHHSPTSLNNPLVGQETAGVPNQMSDAVDTVEGEGHGNGEFNEEFGQQRQSTKSSCDGRRLKVPANDGCNEVGSSENVERTRDSRACNAMQRTGIPGDLRAVDGKMGSNRAVQALLRKDFTWVGCVDCC
jgi:hypothetical protein